MKVFSWLQNKLSGCHGCKKSNSIATDHHPRKLQESRKEEFSNWPDELLAIGTFGNNDMKQHPGIITNHPQHDGINIPGTNNVVPDDDDAVALQLNEAADQDQLITSEEYLGKVEQLILNEEPTEMTNDHRDIVTDNKSLVLPRKGTKDVDGANKKKAMAKRTVSFLLKKILCKSGFSTARPLPSLRDPPSGDPRLEKILRAILNKKIYPQTTSQGTPLYPRRYIENTRHRSGFVNDEDGCNKEADSLVNKWVRTDSEYIVLEI